MTTPTIPTVEPIEFAIGETLKWRKTFKDYKASDGWDLSYYLRGAGPGLDIEGTNFVVVDGDSFLVTIPAESTGDAPSTSNLTAGTYYWQAYVSLSGERYKVGDGQFAVKANLFDATVSAAYDGRTANEVALAAVRAALAQKATADQLSYTIGNRQVQRYSLTELIALESRLTQLVNQDRRAEGLREGLPFFQNVHARFTEPR
jgi:hypothetical protein